MAQPCSCRSPDEAGKSLYSMGEETVNAVNKICPGRTVLGTFPGRIYHRDNNDVFHRAPGDRLMDYLIVTDEHLVFWERGESGQRTGIIGYREIKEIECQTGLVFGDLIISARSACMKLGDVPSRDVFHIRDLVAGRIKHFRNVTRSLLSTQIYEIARASTIFG